MNVNLKDKDLNLIKKNNVKDNNNWTCNKFIYIILIIIIIIVITIYFVTKNNSNYFYNGNNFIYENDDALSLGEKKYLEFLWLVDGAFNDSRYNTHIKVNNKEVNLSKFNFSCKYDEKKEWCKSENFESAFSSVFASNITYNEVYGDIAYVWYEKRKDGYYFKNPTGCDAARMSDNQTIELVKEEKDKLTFKVQYVDNMKSGIYKGEHKTTREFVLVREGNEWKVSKAHYHDLCFQDYYIPKNY